MIYYCFAMYVEFFVMIVEQYIYIIYLSIFIIKFLHQVVKYCFNLWLVFHWLLDNIEETLQFNSSVKISCACRETKFCTMFHVFRTGPHDTKKLHFFNCNCDQDCGHDISCNLCGFPLRIWCVSTSATNFHFCSSSNLIKSNSNLPLENV